MSRVTVKHIIYMYTWYRVKPFIWVSTQFNLVIISPGIVRKLNYTRDCLPKRTSRFVASSIEARLNIRLQYSRFDYLLIELNEATSDLCLCQTFVGKTLVFVLKCKKKWYIFCFIHCNSPVSHSVLRTISYTY